MNILHLYTKPFRMDIHKLTKELEISLASFAQEIGVSRPILSHIQNGRNKPSLAVVQKISNRYPSVSLEWLIHGKGSIWKMESKRELGAIDVNTKASEPVSADSTKPYSTPSHTDELVKIVHYYSSGSFEEFHPKTQ